MAPNGLQSRTSCAARATRRAAAPSPRARSARRRPTATTTAATAPPRRTRTRRAPTPPSRGRVPRTRARRAGCRSPAARSRGAAYAAPRRTTARADRRRCTFSRCGEARRGSHEEEGDTRDAVRERSIFHPCPLGAPPPRAPLPHFGVAAVAAATPRVMMVVRAISLAVVTLVCSLRSSTASSSASRTSAMSSRRSTPRSSSRFMVQGLPHVSVCVLAFGFEPCSLLKAHTRTTPCAAPHTRTHRSAHPRARHPGSRQPFARQSHGGRERSVGSIVGSRGHRPICRCRTRCGLAGTRAVAGLLDPTWSHRPNPTSRHPPHTPPQPLLRVSRRTSVAIAPRRAARAPLRAARTARAAACGAGRAAC